MYAGHTWVMLATQVRRSSQHGPLYYRMQRPHNITSADMQESVLLGVNALSMLHCQNRFVDCGMSTISLAFWHAGKHTLHKAFLQLEHPTTLGASRQAFLASQY